MKIDNSQITAARIKHLLDINSETQQEMADKLGCSRSVISQWISGDRAPGLQALSTLAHTYGVSADWLLGFTPLDERQQKKAAADKVVKDASAPAPVKIPTDLLSAVTYIVKLEERIRALTAEVKRLRDDHEDLRKDHEDLQGQVNEIEDHVNQWDPEDPTNWSDPE